LDKVPMNLKLCMSGSVLRHTLFVRLADCIAET
jgi:hypothetical protein